MDSGVVFGDRTMFVYVIIGINHLKRTGEALGEAPPLAAQTLLASWTIMNIDLITFHSNVHLAWAIRNLARIFLCVNYCCVDLESECVETCDHSAFTGEHSTAYFDNATKPCKQGNDSAHGLRPGPLDEREV